MRGAPAKRGEPGAAGVGRAATLLPALPFFRAGSISKGGLAKGDAVTGRRLDDGITSTQAKHHVSLGGARPTSRQEPRSPVAAQHSSASP